MSLVSEALRKARAEAAEREARERGGIFPSGLVGPPRRPRRRFTVLGGVVVALAAAALGASLTLWLVRTRERAQTPALIGAEHVAAARATPAGTPAQTRAVGTEAPLGAAARPPGVVTQSGGPTPQVAATLPAPLSPPPAPTPADSGGQPPTRGVVLNAPRNVEGESRHEPEQAPSAAAPHRERTFVLNADLGYAKLHLDFLVYKPGAPFGRINGENIVVGSIVDGFVVDEIGPDFIRLSDSKGPVVLRVR